MKKLKKDLPPMFLTFYSTIKEPDQRKEFLDLYSYYCTVEQSLGVTLPNDDQHKLIENNKMISKQEINRLLFQILNTELLSDKKQNILELSQNVLSKISKICNQFVVNGADKIKREIQSLEDLIVDASNNLVRYANDVAVKRRLLESTVKSIDLSSHLKKQFDSICENTNYSEIYYDDINDIFHAVTTHDCILEHDNKQYNFGKYDVSYSFHDNMIRILPYENNIGIIATPAAVHTHVFRNYNMCYGTATASVTEAMKIFDFAKIYSIIDMLLHAYNVSSPTDKIEYFNKKLTQNNYITFFTNYYMEKFIHKNKKDLYRYNPGTFLVDNTIVPYIPESLKEEKVA